MSEREVGPSSEHLKPMDVSQMFLTMETREFLNHLHDLAGVPELHLTIDWKDVPTARRVKAFLEYGGPHTQKRTASIRATEAQMRQEMNVFSSGVTWVRIEPGAESRVAKTRLLPVEFVLPDLSPLMPKEGTLRDKTFSLGSVDWRGRKIDLDLDLGRYEGLQELQSRLGKSHEHATPVQVAVNGSSVEGVKRNRAFRFKGFFFESVHGSSWRLTYRMVEPKERGQGLGDLAVQLWIEVVQRVAKEYPEFRADVIEVDSGLASVIRLLISQQWLDRHGLPEAKKAGGTDFLFEPEEKDAETLKQILREGHEVLEQKTEAGPSIILRRALDVLV